MYIITKRLGGLIMESKNQKVYKDSHVQSVARALTLIELLAQEKRDLSLTELSKKAGWPKSTVHGLIKTLLAYHMVEQSEETGDYRLGIRLFELGNIVMRSWDIAEIAKPYLRKLNNNLGEMVQLAMEDKGEVLYLDKLDSNRMMRIVSEIGIRLPMHCSGLGKVLLAYKKEESEMIKILTQKGMRAMTANTIVSIPDFLKEAELIRTRGYAMDDQEIMDGLRCVAVPIFDANDQVNYAISISGFYGNLRGEHLNNIIAGLKDAAKNISYDLGYRGYQK